MKRMNRDVRKQARRDAAIERMERRDSLTDEEQRQIIVNRPGDSERERARLEARIAAERAA